MTNAQICTLLLGGIAVIYFFALWNGLVRARNNVDKAFADIDVILQQRHDELGKLVDACRGFMEHERELLTEVTKLRTGYTQARDPDIKVGLAGELETAGHRLRMAVEQYPNLRSNENVLQLQGRISTIETTLADRREFFNDCVTLNNSQIAQLPDALVARLGGFPRRRLLAIPAELKEDVKISLSR